MRFELTVSESQDLSSRFMTFCPANPLASLCPSVQWGWQNIHARRLERWLRGQESLLLCQWTRVQIPAPIQGGSQMPGLPVPRNLMPFLVSKVVCTHMCTLMQTHIHIIKQLQKYIHAASLPSLRLSSRSSKAWGCVV